MVAELVEQGNGNVRFVVDYVHCPGSCPGATGSSATYMEDPRSDLSASFNGVFQELTYHHDGCLGVVG